MLADVVAATKNSAPLPSRMGRSSVIRAPLGEALFPLQPAPARPRHAIDFHSVLRQSSPWKCTRAPSPSASDLAFPIGSPHPAHVSRGGGLALCRRRERLKLAPSHPLRLSGGVTRHFPDEIAPWRAPIFGLRRVQAVPRAGGPLGRFRVRRLRRCPILRFTGFAACDSCDFCDRNQNLRVSATSAVARALRRAVTWSDPTVETGYGVAVCRMRPGTSISAELCRFPSDVADVAGVAECPTGRYGVSH